MKSKTKIVLLEIFIALGIVGIGFLLVILLTKPVKDDEIKIDHTRGEVVTDETITTAEPVTDLIEETSTTEKIVTSKKTSTTKQSTTKEATTKKKTPTTTKKKKNTTKRTTTTKKSTSKVVEMTTIPKPNYTVTSSKSTYPGALDNWEWAIVNAINDERRKNNLKPLKVASELRRKAEEAADKWQTSTNSELQAYLKGYASYANWQNLLDSGNGYNYFITETLNNTKVETNANLDYVGVGVIYNAYGFNSLPTYYYVIIYR